MEKGNTLPQNSKAIVLSPNILEQFDISFGAELPEFSSDFAGAFQARAKSGGTVEYYALIFKNSFAANLDHISLMRDLDDASIQKVVDFGKVRTGQSGENLCVILKKPEGVNLETIMLERGVMDETFVISHIFNHLSAIIESLHKMGVMHGCINPKNIYFNPKNGSLTLKENISEYPGYSQFTSFETYERMVCHKAGKSYREFEADYYALGVTLCCLLNGGYIFKGITDELVHKIKFETGSYESIYSIASAKKEVQISDRNENLVKGLIHDKVADRWSGEQIKKWRKREISQSSISRLHRQSSTAFEFEEVEYYSPKYLAYIIGRNWSSAKKNMRISDIGRWLTFTSKFSDIENKLLSMTRGGQEQVIIPDDKLSRVLFLMDEGGPFRYKKATFHIDGLGNLLAYLNDNPDEELQDNILTAMDYGLIESWILNQPDPNLYKNSILGWNPKNLKFFARKKDIGFGFERVMYETAKYLPCQSLLIDGLYSVGLPALLANLNIKRLSYNEDSMMDNHISSYICKYVEISDSIKIKQLQNFPSLARNKEVKYCAILALAQKKSELTNLPALTQWIREGLSSVLEFVKSKKIKKKVTDLMDKSVAAGDTNKLFAIITNSKFIKNDIYGFREAKKQYMILSFEIMKLKSQTNIDQLAYRLGLRISVIFSYLICIVSVLSLLILNF